MFLCVQESVQTVSSLPGNVRIQAFRARAAGLDSRVVDADPQAPDPFSLELLLWAKVCLAFPVQGWRAVPEGPSPTALPLHPLSRNAWSPCVCLT